MRCYFLQTVAPFGLLYNFLCSLALLEIHTGFIVYDIKWSAAGLYIQQNGMGKYLAGFLHILLHKTFQGKNVFVWRNQHSMESAGHIFLPYCINFCRKFLYMERVIQNDILALQLSTHPFCFLRKSGFIISIMSIFITTIYKGSFLILISYILISLLYNTF